MSPCIIEERKLNTAPIDLYSKLLQERIIFIGDGIDDELANSVQAQLLYLDSINNDPITIYINSPGGYCHAGLAIYDTIKLMKSPITTVCTGMAASMGSILLVAGSKRCALKHSKIMLHEPSTYTGGKATDVLIEAKEIEKTRLELASIYAEATNHSVKEIMKLFRDDHWFTSKEAMDYGIINKIL